MKQKRFTLMFAAVLLLTLLASGMAFAHDNSIPEQPTSPTLELPEACVGDYQATVAQWDGTTWPIRIDVESLSEECQQALQESRPSRNDLPEICQPEFQAAIENWDGATWPPQIDFENLSEECQQAMQDARQSFGPQGQQGFGPQGRGPAGANPQGQHGFGPQGRGPAGANPQGQHGFGPQGRGPAGANPQGQHGFGPQGASVELPEACQADFQAAVASWDGTTWPIRIDPSTLSETCQEAMTTARPNFPGGSAPVAPTDDTSGQ